MAKNSVKVSKLTKQQSSPRKAKSPPEKAQAQRFLEAAKKAQVDQSGRFFHRAMGKITLAKNARKPSRLG